MIRFILKIPVVLLFCASVFAQTATVNKKTLDAGSPNLFFENLSLALNEKSGQTMLTWEKHPGNHPGHSTLLMKLNSAGKVRGAEEILIQGTNTYDPGIVYNKNKNEFAMVYADEVNGSLHAIYIQALDPAGQKQGSPVRVSTDTGPSFVNQAPDFTYDPIARVYVVVWIRNSITPGTPGEGIFGAILDEDFQTIAGPRLIQGPKKADPSAPRFPQIADVAVTSTGKFVIGLIDFLSITPIRVNYSVVAGNIDLTNLSKFKLKNGRSEVLIPDIKFVQFASALNAYFTDTNGIQKRRINPTGRPYGKKTPAFEQPLKKEKLFRPVVALLPSPVGNIQGLLVSAEDPFQRSNEGKIWGQALDLFGKPIGNPMELDSGFITMHSPAILALPSSTQAKAVFAFTYSNGTQLSVPPQGEFSQLLYLKITITKFGTNSSAFVE